MKMYVHSFSRERITNFKQDLIDGVINLHGPQSMENILETAMRSLREIDGLEVMEWVKTVNFTPQGKDHAISAFRSIWGSPTDLQTYVYKEEPMVMFDEINLLKIEPFENGTFADELTSEEMYPEGVSYLMTYLDEHEERRTSDVSFDHHRQHESRRGITKGQSFAKAHTSTLININKVVQVDEHVPYSANRNVSFDYLQYSEYHPGYLELNPVVPNLIASINDDGGEEPANKEDEKWLFDTGTVTGSDKYLFNISYGCNLINVVGGKRYYAECTGDVILRNNQGTSLVLREVLYVPGAQNIISGTRLVNCKSHTVQLGSQGFTTTCNNGLLGSLTMGLNDLNGLWYFAGKREQPSRKECVSAVTHNNMVDNKLGNKSFSPYSNSQSSYAKIDINEAHQRLGHMGETALRETFKQHGIKLIGTLIPCEACLLHKTRTKNIRKKAEVKSSYPGERISVDTTGLLLGKIL
jgi:hypothetical protein